MADFNADATPLPHIPEDGDHEDAFISTKQEILDRIKPIKHKADDMANALRLRRSALSTSPPKMDDVIDVWLRRSYKVETLGLPCWLNLIKAIADDNGGANRYLAGQLAKLYPPGTYSKPTSTPTVRTMTKPQQEESTPLDTSGPLTRSVSNTSTGSSRSTGELNTQISHPVAESGEESSVSTTSTSSGTSSTNTSTTFGTTSSGSTSAGSTSYTSASTVSGTNTSTGGSTMGTVGGSQPVSSSDGEGASMVLLQGKSAHIGGQEYQDSSEQATSVEEGKTTIVPSHSEELPQPHDKSTVADDGKGLFPSWGSKQKEKEVSSGDNRSQPPQAKPQEQKNLPYTHPLTPYRMNKEGSHGYALIINNIDIDGRETRKGAEHDGKKLREMLEGLRYKLVGDKVHINCTAQRIRNLIEEAMNLNHTCYDSFICCLMSHGDSGYLYGTDDKPVYIETEIHQKVMDCQGLVGKPKIFFIQACRGSTLPEARRVQSDDHGKKEGIILPEACDVFTGYATSPNTKACRFTDEGSWYVIELGKAFKQYPEEDLHTIVQIAHHQVSTDPEYVYEREERDGKKIYRQSPQLVSTLIKKVYFN